MVVTILILGVFAVFTSADVSGYSVWDLFFHTQQTKPAPPTTVTCPPAHDPLLTKACSSFGVTVCCMPLDECDVSPSRQPFCNQNQVPFYCPDGKRMCGSQCCGSWQTCDRSGIPACTTSESCSFPSVSCFNAYGQRTACCSWGSRPVADGPGCYCIPSSCSGGLTACLNDQGKRVCCADSEHICWDEGTSSARCKPRESCESQGKKACSGTHGWDTTCCDRHASCAIGQDGGPLCVPYPRQGRYGELGVFASEEP